MSDKSNQGRKGLRCLTVWAIAEEGSCPEKFILCGSGPCLQIRRTRDLPGSGGWPWTWVLSQLQPTKMPEPWSWTGPPLLYLFRSIFGLKDQSQWTSVVLVWCIQADLLGQMISHRPRRYRFRSPSMSSLTGCHLWDSTIHSSARNALPAWVSFSEGAQHGVSTQKHAQEDCKGFKRQLSLTTQGQAVTCSWLRALQQFLTSSPSSAALCDLIPFSSFPTDNHKSQSFSLCPMMYEKKRNPRMHYPWKLAASLAQSPGSKVMEIR